MKDSGRAIMGTASASGENRAIRAVEGALNSPLLNDSNIRGARHVLLNIMSGSDDISMDEFTEITDYIQEESGYSAELITGYGIDQSLGDNVNVTIIATGFQSNDPFGFESPKKLEKEVVTLTDEVKTTVIEEAPKQTSIINEIENSVETKEEEPFLITKSSVEEVVVAELPTANIEIPVVEIQEEKVIEEVKPTVVFLDEEENTFEETNTIEFVKSEISVEEVNFTNDVEFVNNVNNESFNQSEETKNETVEVSEKTIDEIVFINSDVNDIQAEETKTELTQEEISKIEREEKIKAAQERIRKLKDITLKLKSPDGLQELEREPSFVRKNVKLEDNNSYSTDSKVSRYSLSEGDDKKMEIKPNNSFLHDNVD
jgi:cell division protein FtsZ